ncbi:fungal-specific transcription factor domain-containing protein [Rostrohypoxylon terebratum]|nr:fungal-specific transcription factor domain-containing protein [Rostrohypoxylon terebratum]
MVKACEFCRRRKIKCDTIKPTCSPCRRNNRSCIYYNGPQKQRPSAALIQSLRDEKAALEDALSRLKTAGDAERHILIQSITFRDGRVYIPDSQSISTTRPSQEISIVSTCQDQANSQPQDPTYSENLPIEAAVGIASDAHVNDVIDNDNDSGDSDIEHGRSSGDEEQDGATDRERFTTSSQNHQDSDTIYSSTSAIRVGSLTQTTALDVPHPKQSTQAIESLRYQLIANAALERQREHRLRHMTTIRGVPAELALHLLDLHWSRQHHTFLLTYRPAFMRELVDGGPYCSDLLLYAVFACSSKFSERLEVCNDPRDPDTAGQHFFIRCDELLLREGLISVSKIPTVIALVMLGSTFIARGMTSKGWLYTGFAIRMVYDLGLHVDSQEVNTSNVEEIEIRRRVFWGAFICEKLQSLYLGRPPTIGLRDASVSQDFLDTFEELELWEPYQDPTIPDTTRIMISSPPPSYSVSVFQQLCLLSKIMTQIIDKIYFVGATSLETMNEIGPLDESLQAWYVDLPSNLTYEPWVKAPIDLSTPAAPNRIILLTTYHSLVVLLHRPFIVAPASQTNNDRPIKMSAYSWKRCTTAARNITSLALSYRSIYPLRKSSYLLSYSVYVACTIHVLNAASLSSRGDKSAYAESSLLLAASLGCLDELAVPNSGAVDTACIIRKLMAAKGVQELPKPVEFEASTPNRPFDNFWQFSSSSPTYDDLAQIQPFQDICLPGQDLLFGFMNENLSLTTFGIDENNF